MQDDMPTNAGAATPDFPWIRYEAEEAVTSGTVHGPSRVYRTPESEASGRRYVKLDKPEDRIEFTVTAPANGIVIRFCLPDAPGGGGIAAALLLSVNGSEETRIPVHSRFMWAYGPFPWYDHPAKGDPHHFFDECHAHIPAIKPGDTLRLSMTDAASCLIDFIELEWVHPPGEPPPDSLSLTDYGAIPGDGRIDTAAFRAALDAARASGRILWIPPGVFHLNEEPIELGGVTIQGAGIWHTVLAGAAPMFRGDGNPVRVSDLAVRGEVVRRIDHRNDNAFSGNFGNGSVFRNLWIEHMKCGFWTTHGTRNLRIEGCRIRNTMADGVNFCDGTSHSTVARSHVRNTGDDGLATWSPSADWSSRQPCIGNAFVDNLIELPWHANGIGVYGGRDHRVSGNTVIDTVFSGAGLLISSGHGALPFEGEIRVANNTFIRTGGDSYIGEAVGGLWLFAQETDIRAAIRVRNLTLVDSTDAAVSIHGPGAITDAILERVTVQDAQDAVIRVHPKARGAVEVRGLDVSPETLPVLRNDSPDFRLTFP